MTGAPPSSGLSVAVSQPLRRPEGSPPESPNLTPWSPDQIAAWNAREAEKRRQIGVPVSQLLPTPAQQAQAEADREARELETIRAQGDPRARLRTAHAALAAAREEMARRTESLDRAQTLVEERRTVLARLKADAEADRSTAVAALLATIEDSASADGGYGLQTHEAPSGPLDTGGTVSASPASALTGADAPAAILSAEKAVEVAEAAALELAGALSGADRAVQMAMRAVEGAATACIVDHALSIADQVEAAMAHLAGLRQALAGVDRLWLQGGPLKLPAKVVRCLGGVSANAGPWSVALKNLTADAETPL